MVRRFPPGCGVAPAREQFSADIGGEFVVLSLATGTYYGLAEVASRVWALIVEGTTVGEIEAAVLAEFDVEPEQCRDDLQRFLADLADRGIVDVIDPTTADDPR